MNDRLDPITALAFLPVALAKDGQLSERGLAELEAHIAAAVAEYNKVAERLSLALSPASRWQTVEDRALALYFDLCHAASLVGARAFAERLRREPFGDTHGARDALLSLAAWLTDAARVADGGRN
jgi:hypothetical protein